jgi:hypothetical protein
MIVFDAERRLPIAAAPHMRARAENLACRTRSVEGSIQALHACRSGAEVMPGFKSGLEKRLRRRAAVERAHCLEPEYDCGSGLAALTGIGFAVAENPHP